MRQDQISKLKAFYVSLGGVNIKWPKESNPLAQFATDNIAKTKYIIAPNSTDEEADNKSSPLLAPKSPQKSKQKRHRKKRELS